MYLMYSPRLDKFMCLDPCVWPSLPLSSINRCLQTIRFISEVILHSCDNLAMIRLCQGWKLRAQISGMVARVAKDRLGRYTPCTRGEPSSTNGCRQIRSLELRGRVARDALWNHLTLIFIRRVQTIDFILSVNDGQMLR